MKFDEDRDVPIGIISGAYRYAALHFIAEDGTLMSHNPILIPNRPCRIILSVPEDVQAEVRVMEGEE